MFSGSSPSITNTRDVLEYLSHNFPADENKVKDAISKVMSGVKLGNLKDSIKDELRKNRTTKAELLVQQSSTQASKRCISFQSKQPVCSVSTKIAKLDRPNSSTTVCMTGKAAELSTVKLKQEESQSDAEECTGQVGDVSDYVTPAKQESDVCQHAGTTVTSQGEERFYGNDVSQVAEEVELNSDMIVQQTELAMETEGGNHGDTKQEVDEAATSGVDHETNHSRDHIEEGQGGEDVAMVTEVGPLRSKRVRRATAKVLEAQAAGQRPDREEQTESVTPDHPEYILLELTGRP